MEVLRVESLSKNFGGIKASQDISFCVNKGERVAILGPNGAGKSTLLNLIDGQLTPSAGQLFYYSQNITYLPQFQRVPLGISRSFQTNKLFSRLSVIENVLLAVQGVQSGRFNMFRPISGYKDLYKKSDKLVELMGLSEKKNNPAQNLSYGEQRKLELALTLASNPKLLLMDEPSCGLTVAESKDIVSILKELGAGITVLIITHDIDLVFDAVDRVIVLHYGKLIADGSLDEIQSDSMVKEVYIGNQGGVASC